MNLRRSGVVLATVVSVIGMLAAPLYARSKRPRPPEARVTGVFAMTATVTAAVGVSGEHPGQILHRPWWLIPSDCGPRLCHRLTLYRRRSDDIAERVALTRTGRGRYAGTGVFYVGLQCLGHTYPRGSQVPFHITVAVRSTATVQDVRFARRITASYVNTSRSDDTPCPLGPSHDAARYTGTLTSPLPSPPTASFRVAVNGADQTASFTGTSRPGAGGARIRTRRWRFGDPRSGARNSSTATTPAHHFSAPGGYTVSLTVVDSYGLSSTATQTVLVPAPPASAARALGRSG